MPRYEVKVLVALASATQQSLARRHSDSTMNEAHMTIEALLGHERWLKGLARALTSYDADDAAQETWLAAMRKPPDPLRPARPWLARVLRNTIGMRRRGELRRDLREAAVAIDEHAPSARCACGGRPAKRSPR